MNPITQTTMRHIHFNHTPLVFVALIMALVFGPALAGNLPFMKDNHKDKKTTISEAKEHDNACAFADSLSRNDSRRYDYFFLEAVRQQNAGNLDAAFDLLNHCISINPKAAEAYYLAALYYSELNNDTMALNYLQKAATLSPANDTYLRLTAVET